MQRHIPFYQNSWFCSFFSPLQLLLAIVILVLFSCFAVNRPRMVGLVSATTFGVYIIHENPLFRRMLINGRFAWAAQLHPMLAFGITLLAGAVLFAACSLLEHGRIRLFARIEQSWNRRKQKRGG